MPFVYAFALAPCFEGAVPTGSDASSEGSIRRLEAISRLGAVLEAFACSKLTSTPSELGRGVATTSFERCGRARSAPTPAATVVDRTTKGSTARRCIRRSGDDVGPGVWLVGKRSGSCGGCVGASREEGGRGSSGMDGSADITARRSARISRADW